MKSTVEAMPWVGLYVAVASLICTLAMAADVFQGFRQRKLWFPCRFFTVNAASITLIGIAMKLTVDLTTEMSSWNVKSIGTMFLFTMIANFLPSLGGMDDKELFMNIIALALTVPASRRILEHQYQELHQSTLKNRHKINFSSTEHIHHVKKYWMMAETGNPQFILASSPFCSASGLLCSICAIFQLIYRWRNTPYFWDDGKSDYKWSINIIIFTQSIGILVASIAPIFRCITTATFFNLSILWSINHLNMFRVEKYWTQRLRHWKHIHVTSYIPGRHCKKVFNHIKNMILNICMALQITLVVICKTICFGPTCIMLLFYSCCHLCNSLLTRFKKDSDEPNNNVRPEIEEYIGYVLQIDEEAKLSKRMLKNMLRSITKLLHESEKKQPTNLVKFIDKSIGFSGVIEFDSDQVPPLHQKETYNCWSLVAVTLTAIALALPNIENGHVKELLASLTEGLQFVRHIEETLNANGNLVKARKTARRIWTEADIYRTWLQIDLQKKTRKGITSKEILQWLGDEAVIKTVIQFKKKKKRSVDDSLHKFIAASSMYRISQTILLHCNELEDWPTDEELFEWISSMIADILCACFTNLPRVITLKCHHNAIEKREESIRTAAQLLGKSKRILNILEQRQLPELDLESMAYIDKWHALPKSQIPNGPASTTQQLLQVQMNRYIVTIM